MRDIVPIIPRYENYVRRFTDGVVRVDRGERDYVCGPEHRLPSTRSGLSFMRTFFSVLGRPRDVLRSAPWRSPDVKPLFVRDVADPEVADATRYGGKASGLSRMVSAGVPGAAGLRHWGRRLSQIPRERRGKGRRGDHGPSDRGAATARGGDEQVLPWGRRSSTARLGALRSSGQHARHDGHRPKPRTDFGALGVRNCCGAAARALRSIRGCVSGACSSTLFWALILPTCSRGGAQRRKASAGFAFEGNIRLPAAACDPRACTRSRRERQPADPMDHLQRAVAAVFRSWDSARAKAYRQHHEISDDLGTAVTVQAMVFGNADENSGSGVAFTRNPNDGQKALYGEYLIGRQGEDLDGAALTVRSICPILTG